MYRRKAHSSALEQKQSTSCSFWTEENHTLQLLNRRKSNSAAPEQKNGKKSSTSWSSLKGQCHEIFCFWFFSWIRFPQASDYTIRVVSNFFENSRRYSQLKVCHRCLRHRWQMGKTFKKKNFNNFVWTPLGSRVNIYINCLCLQVHFKVSAAWNCCHYLPPVSLTPVANLPPVSTTLAKMV